MNTDSITLNEALEVLDSTLLESPFSSDDFHEKGYATMTDLFAQLQNGEHAKTLWHPYLAAVGASAVVGPPDSGKSLLSLQLCIAIAEGQSSFLDLPLTPVHNRAIYVTTEDSGEEVACRAKMQEIRGDATDNLIVMWADGKSNVEIHREIEAILVVSPVDLIVYDAFGDLVEGDENNNSQVRQAIKPFNRLAQEHKHHALFVHHIRKGSVDETPKLANVQGGGAFGAKLRAVFQFQKQHGTNRRFFSVLKGNSLADVEKENSMVLEFHRDTLTYHSTGETVEKSSIGNDSKPRGKKHLPQWDAIFGQDESLPKNVLAKRLQDQGIPQNTAYVRIRESLEVCPTTGNILRPGTTNLPTTSESSGWYGKDAQHD